MTDIATTTVLKPSSILDFVRERFNGRNVDWDKVTSIELVCVYGVFKHDERNCQANCKMPSPGNKGSKGSQS